MEKMNVFGTVLVVFSFLIVGNIGYTAKPINIVVILDTSDRVSREENPDQVDKDLAIAKGIVDLFWELVRDEIQTQERNTWLRHFLAFIVPEQPDTTPIRQDIIGEMKIWPTPTDRDRQGAPWVRRKKDKLINTINELYELVREQQEFTGSDIWKWFRASGEEYLKQDMQNYIICISDGYLDFNRSIQDRRPRRGNKTSYMPYAQVIKFRTDPERFDSEGHGLLEIGKDFSAYDVKFLMVEITLRDMLDLDIIKRYWQKWLSSMGINDSEFVESQSDPEIVKEKIKTFISTNQ